MPPERMWSEGRKDKKLMKKAYKKPMLLMESFGVTQMLSNCSLLIGLTDSACVLADTDSTIPM